MSDRLSDEQVADFANAGRYIKWPGYVEALAREVQDSRRLLAAIRALPDDPRGSDLHESPHWFNQGWREAMRQVKALLEEQQ